MSPRDGEDPEYLGAAYSIANTTMLETYMETRQHDRSSVPDSSFVPSKHRLIPHLAATDSTIKVVLGSDCHFN